MNARWKACKPSSTSDRRIGGDAGYGAAADRFYERAAADYPAHPNPLPRGAREQGDMPLQFASRPQLSRRPSE